MFPPGPNVSVLALFTLGSVLEFEFELPVLVLPPAESDEPEPDVVLDLADLYIVVTISDDETPLLMVVFDDFELVFVELFEDFVVVEPELFELLFFGVEYLCVISCRPSAE